MKSFEDQSSKFRYVYARILNRRRLNKPTQGSGGRNVVKERSKPSYLLRMIKSIPIKVHCFESIVIRFYMKIIEMVLGI